MARRIKRSLEDELAEYMIDENETENEFGNPL